MTDEWLRRPADACLRCGVAGAPMREAQLSRPLHLRLCDDCADHWKSYRINVTAVREGSGSLGAQSLTGPSQTAAAPTEV